MESMPPLVRTPLGVKDQGGGVDRGARLHTPQPRETRSSRSGRRGFMSPVAMLRCLDFLLKVRPLDRFLLIWVLIN